MLFDAEQCHCVLSQHKTLLSNGWSVWSSRNPLVVLTETEMPVAHQELLVFFCCCKLHINHPVWGCFRRRQEAVATLLIENFPVDLMANLWRIGSGKRLLAPKEPSSRCKDCLQQQKKRLPVKKNIQPKDQWSVQTTVKHHLKPGKSPKTSSERTHHQAHHWEHR